MTLIFCNLIKVQKHGFNFLQPFKSFKNMTLIFATLSR
eukprot:UN14047